MSTRTMYDQAYPTAPAAFDVAAGYIGGDTPHVWTPAEWAAARARYRLPIWTRSDVGAVDALADARACIAALRAAGAPAGCTVALDLETAVSGAYTGAFHATLNAAGYRVMAYGSRSTVGRNVADWYWIADWTGRPHMVTGARVGATQWTNGTTYDQSLISTDVPLWDMQQEDDDMATAAEIWAYAFADTGYDTTASIHDAKTYLARVKDIEAAVAKLAQPTVDATALASELAGNTTFVEAIAAAVVKLAGADLKG